MCDRLGVGYEALRAVNPRLIYSSVTAFGPDGPYQERPGFDPLLQAMGGVMTTQGFGGPPKYMRIAVTDYYTAALPCQAILAALFVRERTGRGQHVRHLAPAGSHGAAVGSVVDYPGRETVYRDTPTYRIYQAQDGEWFFSPSATSPSGASSARPSGIPRWPTTHASAPGSRVGTTATS